LEEIEIFILCRDRPDYSRISIESVLKNSNQAKIIISDNSISNVIEKMCLVSFPNISYRKRSNLDPIAHLKVIVEESKSDYLVMFHDDDVMKENYIEKMISLFKSNDQLIAIGSNADKIDENGNVIGSFFKKSNNGLLITNKNRMLLPYMTLGKEFDEFAPFPSYIYKTKRICSEMFRTNDGGNHADLSFLLKVLNNGKIYWTYEKLIQYRVHQHNGSSVIPVIQKISLFNYIKKNIITHNESNLLLDFRFRIWLPWLKFRLKNQKKIARKELIVFKFLFFHFLKIFFTRPAVILYHFLRLLNKQFK